MSYSIEHLLRVRSTSVSTSMTFLTSGPVFNVCSCDVYTSLTYKIFEVTVLPKPATEVYDYDSKCFALTPDMIEFITNSIQKTRKK